MTLRKSWMLIVVVIFSNFLIPIAYADDLATIMQKGFSDIITYLTSSTEIKNQADAELIFMAPPGTTEAAKKVGVNTGVIESNLNRKLLPKEVADINWSLYTTPRQDEQIKGDPFNNFIENHKNYFCSPSSDIEKTFGTQACSNNTMAQEHADIKTSSLLEPSIYDQSQQILAEEVIRNLTLPFASDNLKDTISNGIPKSSDKSYVAKTLAKQAAVTVARNSLNEIYGSRLPENSITPISSIMSIMEQEAGRRFKNSDWYDAVSQSSSEALLRELAHMEAYKLWMDYNRYRQSERMEALLAVLVSQTVDQGSQLSEAIPR